jgi:hypothetical protein
MLPLGSSDGIVINIKASPEQRIRNTTTKIAKGYAKIAICSLVIALLMLMLMAFCRNDIASFTAGKDEYELMNVFFSLDIWKQWAIVLAINVWGVFEILFTLALKRSIYYEKVKWLRIWIWIDLFDCTIAGIVLLVILLNLSIVYGLVFGVFMVLAFLYEIYVLNTLYKFIQIISKDHNYKEVA